jgi:hypothetical protein
MSHARGRRLAMYKRKSCFREKRGLRAKLMKGATEQSKTIIIFTLNSAKNFVLHILGQNVKTGKL